ncbi:hypothetical protein OGR47_19850 (plasmid) [Methylocystis sp. MJC1]|uniref:hypothetical protein n=1 Tax=Methylocystis sp. MJC1 TaxID=2654282 RepID=UPI0013EC98EC|nr:hypothetical protein [Methylocystis sp. MJC1]KAF2991499.1 hypothetical protein MJC1_01487 [Methylocystis sp. MJC1]MBU6529188.1 hypothetical protein [Methylocystis sp. MJC1]UZX13868.1 hypothetical protein OGR47_19850 [Methylocystis sp. MJC1]
MDELAIVRALHVLAVVLWTGGVAFVTLVLLPAVRRFKAPAERVAFFDAIERRNPTGLGPVTDWRANGRSVELVCSRKTRSRCCAQSWNAGRQSPISRSCRPASINSMRIFCASEAKRLLLVPRGRGP